MLINACQQSAPNDFQQNNGHGGPSVVAAEAFLQELPLPRYAVANAVESASPWVVNVVAGFSTGKHGFDPCAAVVMPQSDARGSPCHPL